MTCKTCNDKGYVFVEPPVFHPTLGQAINPCPDCAMTKQSSHDDMEVKPFTLEDLTEVKAIDGDNDRLHATVKALEETQAQLAGVLEEHRRGMAEAGKMVEAAQMQAAQMREAILLRCPRHLEGENGLPPHHIDKFDSIRERPCDLTEQERVALSSNAGRGYVSPEKYETVIAEWRKAFKDILKEMRVPAIDSFLPSTVLEAVQRERQRITYKAWDAGYASNRPLFAPLPMDAAREADVERILKGGG